MRKPISSLHVRRSTRRLEYPLSIYKAKFLEDSNASWRFGFAPMNLHRLKAVGILPEQRKAK